MLSFLLTLLPAVLSWVSCFEINSYQFQILFIVCWFQIKVGLSPSKTGCVICLVESPLKVMKNAFYFILKALFVLKIFKLLSQLFGHVGKTVWLERLQNSWCHNLVSKQLQYTYYPISHKIKVTRQWILVN